MPIAQPDSGPTGDHPRRAAGPVAPPSGLGSGEAVLAASQQPLQSQLEHALRELADARNTIAAANAARERFLSSILHELRTPLSAIVLWSSLIEDERMEPAQLREAIDAIKRSAEEQRMMIEDMVDTARIIAGKLRLEPADFQVTPLVQDAIDDIRDEAKQKGLALLEDLDPQAGSLHGDSRRLRQALNHVLRNAVKFTPSPEVVRITLRRDRHHRTLIEVADQGIGISPETLPLLREGRFPLRQPAARTECGHGVGLAIATRIADVHGGSLTIESSGVGGGATVTLRLPAPPDPAPHP